MTLLLLVVGQGTLLPPPPPGMDPNLLIQQLMPVIGFVVFAIVAATAFRWFLRSPIAEAIAERLRVKTRQRFGDTGAGDTERVAGLEHQVLTLQSQLSELAERVDFAERLLAERRERKLSAGQ